MKKFLILLFLSVGLSQTTFTDEEMINLENDFIYLENMVDSLAFEDSLKTILVSTLEEELDLTKEELINSKFVYSTSYKVQDKHSDTIKTENIVIENLMDKIYQEILIKLTEITK